MKLLRLCTMFTFLLLTGALDYFISAIPLLTALWLCGASLLGLAELARDQDRDQELGLVKIPLGR